MMTIIGGRHPIDNDRAAVSIVRQRHAKFGHAFMIIELVKEGKHEIWDADLIMADGGQLSSTKNSSLNGSSKKTLDSSAQSTPSPCIKAEIRLEKMDSEEQLEHLQAISGDGNYEYQTITISPDQADQMLGNIRRDMNNVTIYYNKMGDGSTYSSSFSSSEYHSCVSYCVAKAKEIKAPVVSHWYNFIVVLPTTSVPSNTPTKSSCVLS